jgi:hypothetical protein
MYSLSVNGKSLGYGNEWDGHGSDRFDAVIAVLDIIGVPYKIEEIEKPYEEWHEGRR